MWRLPIQNHPKLSITEKRQSKAQYSSWSSRNLSLWRRPECQTLSKTMGISNATARVAPDLFKALVILSNPAVRNYAVDQEDLKPYWKSEGHNSLGVQQFCFLKFFKGFTNHRTKTNRDHYRNQWWDLPTIWKTKLLQTLIEEFS